MVCHRSNLGDLLNHCVIKSRLEIVVECECSGRPSLEVVIESSDLQTLPSFTAYPRQTVLSIDKVRTSIAAVFAAFRLRAAQK